MFLSPTLNVAADILEGGTLRSVAGCNWARAVRVVGFAGSLAFGVARL